MEAGEVDAGFGCQCGAAGDEIQWAISHRVIRDDVSAGGRCGARRQSGRLGQSIERELSIAIG